MAWQVPAVFSVFPLLLCWPYYVLALTLNLRLGDNMSEVHPAGCWSRLPNGVLWAATSPGVCFPKLFTHFKKCRIDIHAT
jgi:hypothetical protein